MLIGDPQWITHPVELMGRLIETLRKKVELIAGDTKLALRLGGVFITFILIFLNGLIGWFLERLALPNSPLPQIFGAILLVIAMASTIAAKSLRESASAVLNELNQSFDNDDDLKFAREKLSHIVGRNVWHLNKSEILRATAETVSENSVDGVFGPLFWMVVGASLWELSPHYPGPLALALIYKSSSTLDSMLGYKHGRLKWIGTAGAKLDDLLTWLPCRTVLITLPIVSKPLKKMPTLVHAAWVDGSKDNSPNSGISEAIFAHCAEVRMGGVNKYGDKLIRKPTLAKNSPEATIKSIKRLLRLTLTLEFAWLTILGIIALNFALYKV